MKKSWSLIKFIFLLCLFSDAYARPVDLSAPSNELGAADLYGNVEIWRETEGVGIEFGKGSYLPFRYKFSSDNQISGILGPGFYVPMFEAKNFLIREKMMRAFLPCGKGLYLRRDNVDHNLFKTVDQEWTGYLFGEEFKIWRNDGWLLLYRKGKLTSLTSDDNHKITWIYQNENLERINKDNILVVSIHRNDAGFIELINFGDNRLGIKFANRPITQSLNGQIIIKELSPALSIFRYGDGKQDKFEFELTENRNYKLTTWDRSGDQSFYTWDPVTHKILSESNNSGKWTYQVGLVSDKLDVPTLSRTDDKGKIESISLDRKTGTYEQVGVNGDKIITHVFEASGPLYNKVQDVERVRDGQSSIIFRAAYNEAGKLIRKVNENGFTSIISYDEKGNVSKTEVYPPSDPLILDKLKHAEEDLIQKLKNAKSDENRDDIIQSLAFFYIYKVGDVKKAASLISKVKDSQIIYNIKLQSIVGDTSMSAAQQVDRLKDLLREYPDFKESIEPLISIKGSNQNASHL